MPARHASQLAHAATSVSPDGGDELIVDVSADLFALTSSSGSPLGDMSVFSYVVRDAAADRPLLVVFNGGPGSSSAWLHVSGIAAVTVPFDTDLAAGGAVPSQLISSPHSVLDAADVLFVDPIGAGFGRVAPDAERAALHGVHADARLFADVVRAWLRRAGRVGTPVHLVGESYGTIRAAALAVELQGGFTPIRVAGVALLGQALNVQETAQRPANVIGHVAALSVLAAVGHFHGLVAASDVDAAVSAARVYARTGYVHALMQGSALAPHERAEVAARLEQLTGLAAAEWERRDLRITKEEFRFELLRSRGQVIGRYDGRYLAQSWDPRVGDLDLDPSLSAVVPSFHAAITLITSRLLGLAETEREYVMFDPGAVSGWEWDADATGPGGPFSRFDYAQLLNRWMRDNPRARLLIGTGLYDTLTTVGAVDHLLAGTSLPPDRVTVTTYAAGHMMYTDPAGGAALAADLRALVR